MGKIKTSNISEHFLHCELSCKCQRCNSEDIVVPELIYILETIRWYFGKPISISSARRCVRHNANVGGKSSSLHIVGKACDFNVVGVDNNIVQEYCDALIGNRGGLGRYDNFTHIDVRGIKARWDCRTNTHS